VVHGGQTIAGGKSDNRVSMKCCGCAQSTVKYPEVAER
jgi:hypothetical protein